MGNLEPRTQAVRGVGDILNMIRGTVYPPAGESQDVGNIINQTNKLRSSPSPAPSLLAPTDSDLHA